MSHTNLKGDHPAKFCLIWFSGCREEHLNVKVYDIRQTSSDGKSSISIGLWSGELKTPKNKDSPTGSYSWNLCFEKKNVLFIFTLGTFSNKFRWCNG